MVEALPRPTLEVIEAELLFQLLIALFYFPSTVRGNREIAVQGLRG